MVFANMHKGAIRQHMAVFQGKPRETWVEYLANLPRDFITIDISP